MAMGKKAGPVKKSGMRGGGMAKKKLPCVVVA